VQHRLETQSSITLEEDPTARKFKKILVIGLGQLGLPVAKYIRNRGFETYGLDLNREAMNVAKSLMFARLVRTIKISNTVETDGL